MLEAQDTLQTNTSLLDGMKDSTFLVFFAIWRCCLFAAVSYNCRYLLPLLITKSEIVILIHPLYFFLLCRSYVGSIPFWKVAMP